MLEENSLVRVFFSYSAKKYTVPIIFVVIVLLLRTVQDFIVITLIPATSRRYSYIF
jgi:hypothetical protein